MSGQLSKWLPMAPKMWIESFEADLLFEDFNNGVVPYRWDRDSYMLSGAKLPRLLSINSNPYMTGSRIDEFIRETAARLLVDHEVWLEVVIGDETDKESPFRIVPVLAVKRSLNGDLVQEIPGKELLPDWFKAGIDWKNETRLDSDAMVHIELPDGYPSNMLWNIYLDLAELGSGMTPEWYTSQLFSQSPDPTPFDIADFSRTHRLGVLQATRQIGWTAREVLLGETGVISDYLRCLRELRFLHFRAAMRSQAEEGLRKAFEVAKQRTGYRGKIIAEGLYTPSEIEFLTGQFERGEIPFSTVSDIMFEKSEESSARTRSIL